MTHPRDSADSNSPIAVPRKSVSLQIIMLAQQKPRLRLLRS